MIYYDTIYLRRDTRRLLFMLEYAIAFNEFYGEIEQGYIDPLSNINFKDPQYWAHWKKCCELTEWCYNNKLHPKDFWFFAYQIITETGNGTKSFNTFGEEWMLNSIYKRKIIDDRIILASGYTKNHYYKKNPYFFIYYSDLIIRLKKKYGSNYTLPLTNMLESGKLFIEVFEDFSNEFKLI